METSFQAQGLHMRFSIHGVNSSNESAVEEELEIERTKFSVWNLSCSLYQPMILMPLRNVHYVVWYKYFKLLGTYFVVAILKISSMQLSMNILVNDSCKCWMILYILEKWIYITCRLLLYSLNIDRLSEIYVKGNQVGWDNLFAQEEGIMIFFLHAFADTSGLAYALQPAVPHRSHSSPYQLPLSYFG